MLPFCHTGAGSRRKSGKSLTLGKCARKLQTLRRIRRKVIESGRGQFLTRAAGCCHGGSGCARGRGRSRPEHRLDRQFSQQRFARDRRRRRPAQSRRSGLSQRTRQNRRGVDGEADFSQFDQSGDRADFTGDARPVCLFRPGQRGEDGGQLGQGRLPLHHRRARQAGVHH